MRSKLLAQYPPLAKDDGALLEQIWPKKDDVALVKFSREHVSFLKVADRVIFWQHFDGHYYPTLQLAHQCQSPCITATDGAAQGRRS